MKRLYTLLILIFCHHTISAQWQQTNGPGGGVISSFASVGNNLFVATTFGVIGSYGAGVFLSTDNGATWTPKSVGLASTGIFTLVSDGSNLYVGTDGGLYVSFDRGINYMMWNAGLPKSVPIHDIAIQQRDNEIVLGTHGRSLYVAKLDGIQKLKLDPAGMKK